MAASLSHQKTLALAPIHWKISPALAVWAPKLWSRCQLRTWYRSFLTPCSLHILIDRGARWDNGDRFWILPCSSGSKESLNWIFGRSDCTRLWNCEFVSTGFVSVTGTSCDSWNAWFSILRYFAINELIFGELSFLAVVFESFDQQSVRPRKSIARTYDLCRRVPPGSQSEDLTKMFNR